MKTMMNTHLGNISIDSDVIANYAGSVAIECIGVVGMASVNVKDGLVKLLKLNDLSRGVTVHVDNAGLTIDFHLIVAYGVNILAVSDNLISNVKYKVEEFTGFPVEKINIFVDLQWKQRICLIMQRKS